MPLYDFQCTNQDCGHEFEELVKLDDIDDSGCVNCPECHMPAIRKISNPGHYKHRTWSEWRMGE